MDQSDTQHLLRLPVLDCPQVASLGADLASYAQALQGPRLPSAAEQAASILAAHAPTAAPVLPLSPAMSAELQALRLRLAGADKPEAGQEGQEDKGEAAKRQKRRSGAEVQQDDAWHHVLTPERKLILGHAGIRQLHPDASWDELAARTWGEFPPGERAAIAQSIRLIAKTVARLSCIGAGY